MRGSIACENTPENQAFVYVCDYDRLAIAVGTGGTGRATAPGRGEPACTSLATAQFATVTTLSMTYEAGSA